ncbi:hypothetical protein BS78_06G235100 [Paspalum vaginatum]|nr:hypothetical protein BS78_06G235100 [Paspalum vaginatum]
MDFTAPSFSLGFDSDDDDPAPPAGSDRREQPRVCAAPDAPSFSLGIDFDHDVEEEPELPAGRRREEQARVAAAPDPPPFSLGIDDDAEEEPELPARGRREEQARVAAAPDPPSFSLGIDNDDDDGGGDILAGGQCHQQARPQVAAGAPSSTGIEEDDDDFVFASGKRPARVGRGTLDSDPMPPPPLETNRLKRLREGPAPAHPTPNPQARLCEAPDAPSFSLGISDDDGDFLAGDHKHKQPTAPAACGASSSLSVEDEDDDFFDAGDRMLEPAWRETTTLKRLRKGHARPHLAPAPPPLKVPGPPAVDVSPVISENVALGAVGSLDDEIEDWTTDEDRPVLRDVPQSVGSCCTSSNSKFSLLSRGVLMTQSAAKAKASNSSASMSLEESCTKKLLPKITISPMRKIHLLDSDTDADDDQSQNKAKKPVSPVKKTSTAVHKGKAMLNDSWATPAFDEFCNEYFQSTKDAGFSQQKEGNKFSSPKGSQSRHVQQQSSSRGAVLDDILDSHPPATHYFFHHDQRVRDLVRDRLQHFFPLGAGSTRDEQSRGENLSYRRQSSSSAAANDDWVTPNRRISVPTDVGKRRVHASGTPSGSGHWFTNDSGRKVYVSKNGQELTGQNAYRQYQKESGKRFNKYRKKGSSGTKRGAAKVKAETAAKQGTSRAKRKR